jgi:hypothetical protein
MMRMEKSRAGLVGAGLISAAGFGQAGGAVEPGAAQSTFWAVSSIGLVFACLLLAITELREKNDVVATGFVLLAIGESLMWAGGCPGDPGQPSAFAAGVLLYVPALLAISAPKSDLPKSVRALGIVAAVPWLAYAMWFLGGKRPSPVGPLAISGYIALSATCIAWAVVVLRRSWRATESAEMIVSSRRAR